MLKGRDSAEAEMIDDMFLAEADIIREANSRLRPMALVRRGYLRVDCDVNATTSERQERLQKMSARAGDV